MERIEWDEKYGAITNDALLEAGYWRFVLVHRNERATTSRNFVFNPEILN